MLLYVSDSEEELKIKASEFIQEIDVHTTLCIVGCAEEIITLRNKFPCRNIVQGNAKYSTNFEIRQVTHGDKSIIAINPPAEYIPSIIERTLGCDKSFLGIVSSSMEEALHTIEEKLCSAYEIKGDGAKKLMDISIDFIQYNDREPIKYIGQGGI